MKLRLKKIPPFDARRGGLKRSQCPGVDIRDAHHLASAEIWHTPGGDTLLRFRTSGNQAHFRASSSDGTAVATWNCKQLEVAVYGELADWLGETYDNDD